jgi:mannosyl-3-phosphoglycerate phosphatase
VTTPWVVFTDLDESLLDRETYSFEAAAPALDAIRGRGIPLVLVTSKTAAETRELQGRLGVDEPFVVESGGGVYVPKGYFAQLPRRRVDRATHDLLPLSAGYGEVLRGLGDLKEFTASSIRGFDDMTVDEIATLTRLPAKMAALAKQREFDEPFHFIRREAEFASHLPRVAREIGLRVSKGGRFYHLHGDTDKGMAVRLLKALFAAKLGPLRSMGLGDSEMDRPMLAETDVPIVIPHATSGFDPVLMAHLSGARRASAPGPAGWNASVLELLEE